MGVASTPEPARSSSLMSAAGAVGSGVCDDILSVLEESTMIVVRNATHDVDNVGESRDGEAFRVGSTFT